MDRNFITENIANDNLQGDSKFKGQTFRGDRKHEAKQNHIRMYDRKHHPDQLENKRRCRNNKPILG